ncbi:2'-5' RNA ligase superfamily [Teratosphaeria destructans]|uniref:2'-5' RNA ligase superfamily n=1 Tax=Teratosphaeria destructans TaxID=418781 RepID=A0A9W7VY83_9PEZI|nr:2'-5' RNA ligase superfamily [Teratosphaeria destructans]
MTTPAARSYAAAATSGPPGTNRQSQAHSVQHPRRETHEASVQERGWPRRSPSPRQRPWTASEEDEVYVLTLQTNKPHHHRMTQLRDKYFPETINKLEAHLTLFHALPGSKLESSHHPRHPGPGSTHVAL